MKVILENNPESLSLACQYLRKGKVISLATDTVYGLAVDASDKKAVERLYNLKNRDLQKPIAIFVKDLAVAEKIFCFDETSKKIAQEFLPGMLTLVLKKKLQTPIKISENLNAAENFLGFRIVDRDFIKNLLEIFDGSLAVTSANPAGEEAAISAEMVKNYFLDCGLDLLIDGGTSVQKNASTVVRVKDGNIEILRQGAIPQISINKIQTL
jgi:L-threonylcarbamoyladenylate synthase